MLGRRNGLARIIYDGLHEGGRFVGRAISHEVQYCLNTMWNREGFSAHRLLFGPNTAGRNSWQDGGADLDFVRNTAATSQFMLQWELRTTAKGAMLKKMAERNMRHIPDHNRTFEGADVAVGDSGIFYWWVGRKITPKSRDPAIILEIDETGVIVKSQIQTCEIAL